MTDIKTPPPSTHVVGCEGTLSAGEQRRTDDRLNRSHVGDNHHGLPALVGHVNSHREGVAGLEQNSGQELLQTLDGFGPHLTNVGAFRADVINTLHTVVEVEKIAGQDQAPSFERADQSLVEPHGKAHEIANIAPSATADKPSNPFGQKRTVPAPEPSSTADFGPFIAKSREVLTAIGKSMASGPAPQDHLMLLDWSNFDGPRRNVEWAPNDQDLIYTALNYRDDDYGDADEDVGQQLVERLLSAWKRATEASK